MPTPSASPAREPRWQRLEHDERRAQILECACRLFTQRPYPEVSMADIAACAGVRRGLLHHYFGNKRDLHVEVVRGLLGRFESLREAVVPAPAPLEDLVAAHVDGWLAVVEQQAESWFAIVLAGGSGPDPEVRALVERARDAMIEGVVAALALSDAGPEARVVLRAFAGLADVVTREWLQRATIDRAQAHALLSSSLLALLHDVVPAVAAASPA